VDKMPGKMNPVNWFEIPVTDLERAIKFYESALDVKLSRNDMGPLKMAWFPRTDDAMGATGSLVKADNYIPSHAGTLVYITVADINATLAKINAKGGKTLLPRMAIGEYGFIAHFEDSEGNRVALHSVN
jgi:predicted enzyme related to lactoylglutathione lyase